MPDKAALKAGVFILLMVALALGMTVAIAGTGSLFRDTQSATVEFSPGENVSDLKADAQVRVLGVPVGRVTAVRAVPDEQQGARVEVDIELPADFQLKRDTQVVASSSLTGDAWLDIDHLGEGDALRDDDNLDGVTLGLSALIDQAKSLVPQAKEVLARADEAATSIRDLADAAREKVDPVSESVTNLTDRGAEAATELRDVLGDTKVDIRTTIANVKETTSTVRERLPGTFDDAKELMAKTRESLDKLPGILDKVDPAVGDGKDFIAQLKSTLADNRPKVDRILTSVSRTADDASGAVGEIRAAPWRLLFKPDAAEQRNLALYSVARQYARGAQDLESAARALERAAGSDNPDPDQVAHLRRDLEDSFQRFAAVQDALWRAVRD